MLSYHTRCQTCGRSLNDPHNMRETLDCGKGDCVKCMASFGNQDAIDVMTTFHSLNSVAVAQLKETWEGMKSYMNPEHPDADERGWVTPPTPDWLNLLEKTSWPNDWRRSKRK